MNERFRREAVSALLTVFLLYPAPACAQQVREPEPAPLPPPIEAPREQPYAGPIGLLVDISDVQRRIINVEETLPVASGDLTLLYPEWIPGTHSPTGPISKFAGLVITAGGKQIPWVRDRVQVYAFHVAVPDRKSVV